MLRSSAWAGTASRFAIACSRRMRSTSSTPTRGRPPEVLKVGALVASPMAGVAVFLIVLSGYSPLPVVLDTLAAAGEYAPNALAESDIPADVLPTYQAGARTCPGMDWAILAAIGKIESNHGRSTLAGVHAGQNSAGPGGPQGFPSGPRRAH